MKEGIFKKIGNGITSSFGMAGLKIRKHSPEILITAGVIGLVGSTVLACKATLEVEERLENAKANLDNVKAVKVKDYYETDKEYKKDLTRAYFEFAKEIAKLYGPAISLGILSTFCIFRGHKIIRSRNVALAAAYKGLETSYSNYRNRVKKEVGEEVENRLFNNIVKKDIEIVETDEEGKEKKTKIKNADVIEERPDHFSRIFDDGCTGWDKNPEYNLMFLTSQQSYFNDRLNARGHVCLNEVYDALGFPRTEAAAAAGWVKGVDDCVDFGMFDIHSERARDFVNGYERNIVLNFNCQGYIWDKVNEEGDGYCRFNN